MSSVAYAPLAGGLDLVSNPNSVKPGTAINLVNYETPITGGYRSIRGYELLGGGPPPGTGPLLGIAVWQATAYAVREHNGSGTLYKLVDNAWVEAGNGLTTDFHRFTIGNFYGTAETESLYLVGGGKPWKFNGSTLTEFTAAQSGARYIAVHRNYLFLGFPIGSVQWSGLGNPASWDAIDGAGEFGVSDTVTGLSSAPGGVLVVGCGDSIKLLYGTSVDDFDLRDHASHTRVVPDTLHTIGTVPVFQTENGLTSLQAVQSFGDFEFGNWARNVTPLFDDQPAEPVCAMACANSNQYRMYWENGLGLVVTFAGMEPVGISTTLFPTTILSCATGDSGAPREDYTIFCDNDGNVYRMDTGTTFNGEEIRTFMTLAYNHLGGPSVRKRFRRLYLDVISQSEIELRVLPSFNLGSPEVPRHPVQFLQALSAGGFWEIDKWDEFSWGTPILDMTYLWLAGTGTHLSLVINTNSAVAEPHTIHGYTVHFDARRLTRG